MMWTHVSDAALMDVVEGAAGEGAGQHVAQCAQCRARVDEARAALGFAAAATVPEPIPAYWDVMRRRVAHALVEAPAARSRRPLWAAAAVAGAIVIAFLTVGPAKKDPVAAQAPKAAALPAWSPLPEADEDPSLPILELVAPTVAAAMPSAICSDVSECVVGLTDDESQQLADALRAQLAPGRTL
jgi:hypothetical protein